MLRSLKHLLLAGAALASLSAQALTVQHAMGTTEVPDHPKRVIILTNEGTEALLALGVKPVGAVQSWLGNPWYDHIQDQMDGVEVVGKESSVSLETIARLQPDLIIGNQLRQAKIYPQLSAIAPTVFSETLKGQWQNNFAFYAKALNQEAKGEELLAQYQQRITSIQQSHDDKLNMEVSVVRFLPAQTRIYHKDSFSGLILQDIGFKRPEAQDINDFAAKIGRERIPEMEGDILVYFTYETGNGDGTTTEQSWMQDPLWKALDVVQKGNVFKVSDAVWNTSGGILAADLMLDDIERLF